MSYPQLLALSGLSTTATVATMARDGLDRAAIIPRLMQENPQVTLQAIQSFSCQNQGTLMGILGVGLLGIVQFSNSSAKLPNSSSRGGGNIGQVVGLGILLGFGAASVWDDLSRSSISIPWGSIPMYQPQYFNDNTFDSLKGTAIAPPIPLDRDMPHPTATPENDEFVGFHGTVDQFANDLTRGDFNSNRYGINEPNGATSLQFGLGIYVVKAQSLTDDNALGLAEFFAMRAMQNQGSPAVVLKVYARGFSRMSRLLHNGSSHTLPNNYMSYDYIEGTVSNWPDYTQIKFNPHIFSKLSFRI